MIILTSLAAVVKLTGLAPIDWVWVFSPLWAPALLACLIILFAVLFYMFCKLAERFFSLLK